MPNAIEKAIAMLKRTTGEVVLQRAKERGYEFITSTERLSLETVQEKAEDILFFVEQRQAVTRAIQHADDQPTIKALLEKARDEYDEQIRELLQHPKVAARYKEIFDEHTKTLKEVLAIEKQSNNRQRLDELHQEKQVLTSFFRQRGLDVDYASGQVLQKIQEEIDALTPKGASQEHSDAVRSMMAIRENRRLQFEMRRYGYAETASRTEKINEIRAEMRQGRCAFLIQGETNSGKTRLLDYMSQRYLGKTPLIFSLNAQTTAAKFEGRTGLKAASTEFELSTCLTALNEGRPVIFDEATYVPGSVLATLNEILRKKLGETWEHPETGQIITINAPIFFTANLESRRYTDRPKLDASFFTRVATKELHYHDFGAEKDGKLVAPETIKILLARLSNRNYKIDWQKGDPDTCEKELNNFVLACRRIQEDFTRSVREGDGHSSAAHSTRMEFKKNIITIEDMIRIVDAWQDSGFSIPLEKIIVETYFKSKQTGADGDQDNANMIQVFIAQGLFKSLTAAEIGMPSIVTEEWLARLRNES